MFQTLDNDSLSKAEGHLKVFSYTNGFWMFWRDKTLSLFHTCLATCIIFVCVSQTLHSVSLRSFSLLSSVFMFLLPYIYKSLNFITHIIFITLNASRGSLSVIFYPNISAYLLFFLHNTCQYLKILFKMSNCYPLPFTV